MSQFKRFIASFLIVCLTSIGFPMQAFAAIVSTEETIEMPAAAAERDRVIRFFSQDDVRSSLEAQGVDPQAAIERVRALSDVEVQQLASRIDQAPAGGDIVGLVLGLFLLLLVTDILGFTKVFPFTRSVK